MTDHVHVVSARFAKSIDAEHQEWLASGEPCALCGERRVFDWDASIEERDLGWVRYMNGNRWRELNDR